MIFFTADEHYSHKNIIKYVGRPFLDENEMDRKLVNLHNSVVKEDDTVFHLGDFSLRGPAQIHWFEKTLERLNGEHHLILGNHDKLTPQQYLDCGFLSVHTSLIIENFVLVHDPSISRVDKTKIFLVGHIHDLFKAIDNCINVGVDVRNFKPISLNELIDKKDI